jgi:hypothetical protein
MMISLRLWRGLGSVEMDVYRLLWEQRGRLIHLARCQARGTAAIVLGTQVLSSVCAESFDSWLPQYRLSRDLEASGRFAFAPSQSEAVTVILV